MVGESNQNVLLIQIDASSFAEFKIFEFEKSRFDCTFVLTNIQSNMEYIDSNGMDGITR